MALQAILPATIQTLVGLFRCKSIAHAFQERSPARYLKKYKSMDGKSFHVVSYPINNKSDLNVVIVKKQGPLGDEKKIRKRVIYPRTSVQNQNLTHLLKDITSWSVWPLYRTRLLQEPKIYSRNSLYWRCWPPFVPHLAQGQHLLLRIATLFINCYKVEATNFIFQKYFKFCRVAIRRYQRMQVESF